MFSERVGDPLKVLFKITNRSLTVTGEDPETSTQILRIVEGIEARKVVLQQYGLVSTSESGYIFRTTSLKGLLRAASEYVVEMRARALGLGPAVCSFIREGEGELQGLGMSKCILPVDTSKGFPKKAKELGWIRIEENREVYRNYPCIPCSIFGATGLRGLVSLYFIEKDSPSTAHQVSQKRFEFKFFHEKMRGRGTPLEVYGVEEEKLEGFLCLLVRSGHPLRKLYAKSTEPPRLALSVIWLAIQLINAGFFRLGRFKSRGLGWVELWPADPQSYKRLAQAILQEQNPAYTQKQNNAYTELTSKSLKLLDEELQSRLSS